jgi:hypothetical protein
MAAMDEADERILREYSSKRQRPRLLRNSELILGLHGRGATLKEIADTLNKEKQISVPPCTLSRFIASQRQGSPKQRKPMPQEITPRGETASSPAPTAPARHQAAKPATRNEDWRQRIEALKQKPANQEPTEKVFEYDPNKPLTFVKKDEKT